MRPCLHFTVLKTACSNLAHWDFALQGLLHLVLISAGKAVLMAFNVGFLSPMERSREEGDRACTACCCLKTVTKFKLPCPS